MNTKFDLSELTDETEAKLVYFKPIDVADLPRKLREQAGDNDQVFAVHDAEGAQLALVASRELAFHLARENHMSPMAVH
jgi:hypothetical protein